MTDSSFLSEFGIIESDHSFYIFFAIFSCFLLNMDCLKLGSGDTKISITPRYVNENKLHDADDDKHSPRHDNRQIENGNEKLGQSEITTQMIDDNETKMKERIAQCKNIIDSLKIELNEEKAKLEKQNKDAQRVSDSPSKCTTSHQCVSTSNMLVGNVSYTSNLYSDCVDSKLCCDENLIEYEKQLQKYQNTLNLAQIEKKNAIRKQMLAKAYRLKLLEVENQCNIELLRVKQSLQCLEPLQMIANKWKTNTDEMYDVNNFELIPRYPELNANSGSDITSYEIDIKSAMEKIENASKEDSVFSD